LGARVSAAQAPTHKPAAPCAVPKPAAAPVSHPPQRQAAPRQSLADDSDDDLPLAAKSKPAGKPLAVRVKKEEVEVKKEPQSAAEVAPGAVKREEAVKEAVQQLQREADAKASAKKQAAAKESGGKPKTPRTTKSPKGQSAGAKAKVDVKRESDGKGGAKKATGGRAAVKQEGGAVKEIKVYEKLGQKKETPETTDPLRIFYTTTFEQIAALKDNNGRQRNSEMSEKWLLEHGLLPDELIDRAYKKYGRTVKAAPARKKPASSSSGVKRKGDSSSGSSAKKAKTSSGSAKKPASNGSASHQGAKAAAKTPAAKPKPGGGTSTSSKGAGASGGKPPLRRQSSGGSGSGSKAAPPAKRPKAVFSDSDSDDDVPLGQRGN